MKKVSFLSFLIADSSFEGVETWLLEKPDIFRRVVTLNPLMIMKGAGLEDWLSKADLVVPDGVGVCMALAKQEGRGVTPIAGVELVQALIAKKCTCYLVGARPGVVALAAKKIGDQILGFTDGFQDQTDWDGIIQDIKKKRPEFIFVGMGFPIQEKFIQSCKQSLDFGTAIGVGGSIDILAGRVERAPKWVCFMRVEWLYRAIVEPRRFKEFWALFHFYRRYC